MVSFQYKDKPGIWLLLKYYQPGVALPGVLGVMDTFFSSLTPNVEFVCTFKIQK